MRYRLIAATCIGTIMIIPLVVGIYTQSKLDPARDGRPPIIHPESNHALASHYDLVRWTTDNRILLLNSGESSIKWISKISAIQENIQEQGYQVPTKIGDISNAAAASVMAMVDKRTWHSDGGRNDHGEILNTLVSPSGDIDILYKDYILGTIHPYGGKATSYTWSADGQYIALLDTSGLHLFDVGRRAREISTLNHLLRLRQALLLHDQRNYNAISDSEPEFNLDSNMLRRPFTIWLKETIEPQVASYVIGPYKSKTYSVEYPTCLTKSEIAIYHYGKMSLAGSGTPIELNRAVIQLGSIEEDVERITGIPFR